MKTKHRFGWMLIGLAAFVGSAFELTLLSGDAHAVVGRPLTPFSYAGVARRTTRRAVAVGAAAPYAGPAYPAPAPYAAPYRYPAPPPSPYYW